MSADEDVTVPKQAPLLNAIATIGIGVGGVAAAVMLAPSVLPLLGIGDALLAGEAFGSMHGVADGSGVAGAVNGLLHQVPWVGDTLAAGGLNTAAFVVATGIGGLLLGRFMENREGEEPHFSMGKMIRYAAFATSALIALPSALTAMGAGVVYLTALLNPELTNSMIDVLLHTTGATGDASVNTSTTVTGLAATLPHLLTCGVPLVPAFLHLQAHREDKKQRLLAAPESEASPQKYSDGSITLDITTSAPLAKGYQAKVLLQLRDTATGKPLSPDDLSVVHTEKIHLLVVDDSLQDYHHLHPTYNAATQAFECSFTPNTNHSYQCWADVTTSRDAENRKLQGTLPGMRNQRVTPRIFMQNNVNSGGLNFSWSSDAPLQQHKDAVVTVRITDPQGRPVDTLEPVMGAFAHLVGFTADKQSVIHCHPLGKEPGRVDERGGPELQFHVNPDTAGDVQFYVQVRNQGQDVYAPIGQRVKSPEKYTEKLEGSAVQHTLACG